MLKTPSFRDISSLEMTLSISLSCMTRHVFAKEKQKKHILIGYLSGWNSKHLPFAVFFLWMVRVTWDRKIKDGGTNSEISYHMYGYTAVHSS